MPADRTFTVAIEQRPRSPNWQARIYLSGEGGRERRWSTGVPIGSGPAKKASEREARRVAEEHAAGLSAVEGARTEQQQARTLDAIAERMLSLREASGMRQRALDTLEWNLEKRALPYFGAGRRVETITDADLDAFKVHLHTEGRAPVTINNALSAIRAILKHAHAEKIIAVLPNTPNVWVDPQHTVGRRLSPDEVRALVEGVDPRAVEARHFLVFIANTGLRKGEALSVRFSWVDWQAGVITLPGAVTKGGRKRPPVALNEAALGVLRERQALHGKRREPGDDRVFRQRKHDRARKSAAERAGLGRVRNHDLRHTYASELADAGATVPELADALGHRTLAMVQRYQHPTLAGRAAKARTISLGVLRVSAPGNPQEGTQNPEQSRSAGGTTGRKR